MRINSPSSIIIYKQCPRLYYFKYIQKKPSKPHIDLIKGKSVHEALQNLFKHEPEMIEKNMVSWALIEANKLLRKSWDEQLSSLKDFFMSKEELISNYDDCKTMIDFWVKQSFETKFNTYQKYSDNKPITEVHLEVPKYNVHGYADAIYEKELKIIDYKTSTKIKITEYNRLQLSIYAYLYFVQFNKMPSMVGIDFLRETEHCTSVDSFMIEFAEKECKLIKEKTQSSDIEDYPQNKGSLCIKLGPNCPCKNFEP